MIAVVFPGQGSQKVGMGKELCETCSAAANVFDAVTAGTGIDVRSLCWELDEDTLRQTQNAQLALYTAGLAAFRALQASSPTLSVYAYAGHSIGEYAALAAAGVVSVEDGARLVQRRGQLMAESGVNHPGTMAAILGLEREPLQSVCQNISGTVVIANDNCPGQLVISGEIDAVKAACEAALAAGAKRALPINVSGAFHSPLMDEPAKSMGIALREVTFHASTSPVISNVLAAPGDDWPTLLERQLKSPVRWTESMNHLVASGVTTIIECGSGEVLCGLMKRIDKSVKAIALNDSATLTAALEIINS